MQLSDISYLHKYTPDPPLPPPTPRSPDPPTRRRNHSCARVRTLALVYAHAPHLVRVYTISIIQQFYCRGKWKDG